MRNLCPPPPPPPPSLRDMWSACSGVTFRYGPVRSDCGRVLTDGTINTDNDRHRQRETGFPIEMWNYVYFRYDGPRTNNHVEGFHNRLKKKAGKAHPNLYEIVDLFSQEEASTSVHMLQVQAGQPAPKRRTKYDNIDSRLHQLGLHDMPQNDGVLYEGGWPYDGQYWS